MTRSVVFGGSGFLGSHVADKLTEIGHSVTIFDIQPSRHLQASQKMVIGNILDAQSVCNVVKGADYIYNFAGIADIEESAIKPLETVNLNIIGTVNILEACKTHKVKRFIFASSIYVYSHLGSFYRSTKQACEKLIQNYHEEFGLNFTIIRYGSLYGPRANKFNGIQQFIRDAVRNSRIYRKGNGNEIREYIHVLDAAEGSTQILDNNFSNQFAMITGNQSLRVREVLFMIKEIMNKETTIHFQPSTASNHYQASPYSFRPEKARKVSLNSYHDLGQGLLDLIYNEFESYSFKTKLKENELRLVKNF